MFFVLFYPVLEANCIDSFWAKFCITLRCLCSIKISKKKLEIKFKKQKINNQKYQIQTDLECSTTEKKLLKICSKHPSS